MCPMAYKLKSGKPASKAVRKIAREQAARAIEALSKDEVSPADVHEGRKVVKRLRSLLKLIEPALAPREYAKLYKSIGRAGDLLAGARDRHVMEETIADLEARYGTEAISALAPMRQSLKQAKGAEPAHIDAATLQRARAAFTKEALRLEKLHVKGKGLEIFARGLEATYKTARENFAKAYRNPSDERFHEMRKAVQWHWRHMALISRAWPEYFAVRVAACQEVANDLGEDHDLSILLAATQSLGGSEAGTAAAKDVISRRQSELREKAFALAERLLAESPKAFRTRMEAYWTAKKRLPSRSSEAGGPDNV